jgi:F-type H+-transporting ATPase subunit alpha
MKKHIEPSEITNILTKELAAFSHPTQLEEVGSILQIGDGIARIYGLEKVQAGELLQFSDGSPGMVLNLEENHVVATILSSTHNIKEGDSVKRTHQISSLKVSEGMIGRIIDTMGVPMDGKGDIEGPTYSMPLHRKAPGVIYRQPVTTPLQTGIKSIDAMIPIGRGQRELIIGDRQIGKTAILLDTIINQRPLFDKGEPVYCIYVAIGQKSSNIAHIAAMLTKYGAMDYTVIINEPASRPAALQYMAPMAGTAIGEYFRDTGRHALIIYDDLSKQATAYREASLLSRRPPGREAYPGDIFYLHSHLLERSAQIIASDKVASAMNDLPEVLKDKVKGGGSLTALPVIETQGGDVSAYIPTNLISITDGQIFLETDLFNGGIRPAINIGISVSRVGRAAQSEGMKKVSGTLKLDQAQFAELASFAKFGGELDPATQRIITRGTKNQEMLKQPPHAPMPIAEQVATIYVATQGYLDGVPTEKVAAFQAAFLKKLVETYPEVLDALEHDITAELESKLQEVAEDLL